MELMTATRKFDVRTFLKNYALLLSFAVICLVLTLSTEVFLTLGNLTDIVRQSSINGLVAVGMTFVILSGCIDLSAAATVALCGSIAGKLSNNMALAVTAALAMGLLIGLANGLLVTKSKVQPFILTLGMQMIIRGSSLVYTNGTTVYEVASKYRIIGRGGFIGIPVPIVIFVVVLAVAFIVLNKSKLGRYTYAVGSNEEAARLSGIKTDLVRIVAFMTSGLLAALAGVVLTARVGAAEPLAATGWELDAVAAVIIGGTSLRGGQGGVLNTILGVFIISVINNGMTLMNIESFYHQIIKGIIIILAVLIDRNKNK